jgi:hypothetical protein
MDKQLTKQVYYTVPRYELLSDEQLERERKDVEFRLSNIEKEGVGVNAFKITLGLFLDLDTLLNEYRRRYGGDVDKIVDMLYKSPYDQN